MTSKKCKYFSVAEKAKIVKHFDELCGTKVVFAQLQEISVTAVQSILQKKECIKKTFEKVGEKL